MNRIFVEVDCPECAGPGSDCPECHGMGRELTPVNIDWSAAADEFDQLSTLDFDPERAVKAIMTVALGLNPVRIR